ncbi:MAG TPA: ATP-binding protein [Chryseolinea sp.]|nr:ATP-binding protein [Chryseolinea sp.]
MVFKNFRIQVILRVIILTLSTTVFAWCIAYHYYLRSVYVAVAGILILAELIWYIDRFNRDIKTFMLALLQRDFTTHYDDTKLGKSFDGLYGILNQISAIFKKISAEKEIQYRYLEMLIDHVQVGILSFDKNERIHLINAALKRLLNRQVIIHLSVLADIDPALLTVVREIKTGQTKLIKIRIGTELLHLSLHASEFKLNEEYFKLVSMQNIRAELDARDMEAWQKLIRVMTHEIMNSISPITSLSSTLHSLVRQQTSDFPTTPLFNALDQGLAAIHSRSEGLHNFTEAYRRLTRIPTPVFRPTNVKALLERIHLLLEKELKEKSTTLEIHAQEIPVLMDGDLMEQVFINLIRNAIEATTATTAPLISISQLIAISGKTIITISDNGCGMNAETMENIFIPFYTTKKNGSGIGLALSKQILHLHHAEIKVNSTLSQGTQFVISL